MSAWKSSARSTERPSSQQPAGRSRFDGIDPAASIVDGRAEGWYADAFELICCECGDNPYLDWSRV
jgi:hypothetical protein